MKKSRIVMLIFGILMTVFIFSQSLLKANESSTLSNGITTFIYDFLKYLNINIEINNLHHIIRKLGHFSEFFLLSIIWSLYYQLNNKIKFPFIITFIQGLITAIIDETIQTFIPGRSGELLDVLIDTSGVIFGILIIYIIQIIIVKNKNNKISSN